MGRIVLCRKSAITEKSRSCEGTGLKLSPHKKLERIIETWGKTILERISSAGGEKKVTSFKNLAPETIKRRRFVVALGGSTLVRPHNAPGT